METWEQVALGAIILFFVLWRFPTMMRQMKSSQADDQEKDWAGVLIPIGLVVVFVFVLIQLA